MWDALEAAHLKEFVEKQPRQLDTEVGEWGIKFSGGQRQRVAVSRAIVINPKLFLLDEPLSNLDAKLRVSMRTDLRRIHNRMGATSIFVTHDQSEAMSLADRIFIMNKGKIEQVGTPHEVYHESATKFVAGFIGTPPTNFFDVEIVSTSNGLYAKNDLISLAIPDVMKARLQPYMGKKVDLGLRPEYIEVVPSINPCENAFAKASVDFVEQQGSHAILIMQLGNNQLKVETSDYMDIEPGTNLSLSIKKNQMGFFDKETEKRI